MTRWLDDLLLGLTAALMTPLLLRGASLLTLVSPAEEAESPVRAWPARPIRWANGALRRLGPVPIPGRPWRNTCLYRSAAACLILRRRGYAARVVLGVRGEPESVAGSDRRVAAHAWVDVAGMATPGEQREPGYLRLERPA